MSEHEDLIRSLLVERFRPWRSQGETALTPKQLARTMGRERRAGRQGATYHRQQQQPGTTEGRRSP